MIVKRQIYKKKTIFIRHFNFFDVIFTLELPIPITFF